MSEDDFWGVLQPQSFCSLNYLEHLRAAGWPEKSRWSWVTRGEFRVLTWALTSEHPLKDRKWLWQKSDWVLQRSVKLGVLQLSWTQSPTLMCAIRSVDRHVPAVVSAPISGGGLLVSHSTPSSLPSMIMISYLGQGQREGVITAQKRQEVRRRWTDRTWNNCGRAASSHSYIHVQKTDVKHTLMSFYCCICVSQSSCSPPPIHAFIWFSYCSLKRFCLFISCCFAPASINSPFGVFMNHFDHYFTVSHRFCDLNCEFQLKILCRRGLFLFSADSHFSLTDTSYLQKQDKWRLQQSRCDLWRDRTTRLTLKAADQSGGTPQRAQECLREKQEITDKF